MDTGGIDLNLLAALDVLLAERNVTKAAARLHLSQPALSARLNRLRRLFGDQLLIAAPRGMIPTKRGLELQGPLHDALEHVRSVARKQASFDLVTAEATIAFAASDHMYYRLLIPLTFVLRKEAPRLRIDWRNIDGRTIAEQMEKGAVDIGFITPETAPNNLRAQKIYDEEYVCIARRGHPIVKRSIDLPTFCSLDHLIVSPRGGGFTGATDTALEALGLQRRVVLSVPSFHLALEVVANSDLIALAPGRIARGRSDALQILPPPLRVPGFTIVMIWHDRTSDDPALRWVRDRVVSFAKQAS